MRGLQSLLDHRTLAASDSRCAGRARGRRLKFRQYLTQRLHGNGAPVTDNAKPFDQIFKLSHISFPWVLTKKSHALLWYFNRRKGKLLGFFSNQSPYKQRDVVRPFAQRRDHQPQHIQTIKEIQPEFSVRDGLLQIAMRRRDDPHVDRNDPVTADAHDLLFLKHTE